MSARQRLRQMGWRYTISPSGTDLLAEGVQPLNEHASKTMAKVRQKRTGPEELVASALRALGHRYRRNARSLPGTPDFSNKSKHWAVQVHGCFWHNHDCKRGTKPKHNKDFWDRKLAANRARDERVEAELRGLGYQVAVVWECETRDAQALRERLAFFLDRADETPEL